MPVHIVSAGQTSTGLTLSSGDSLFVNSGGKAKTTKVLTGAVDFVESSGTQSTTIVNGGLLFVSSGGYASANTIESGGSAFIFAGGKMDNTTVAAGGSLEIAGIASGTKVNYLDGVNSGGSALHTTVNTFLGVNSGGYESGTVTKAGAQDYIAHGGSGSDANVFGVEYAVGEAQGTTIRNGGVQDVASGGVADQTMVSAGGKQFVFAHGSTVDTVLDGGAVVVSHGATMSEGFIGFDGLVQNQGTELSVFIGGGGTDYTFSGGVVSNTQIGHYGQEIIESHGSAVSATVQGGGFLKVTSGGAATNTHFLSGGKEEVAFKGKEIGPSVTSGALLLVDSGGIVVAPFLSGGGTVELEAGAVVSTLISFQGAGNVLQIDGTKMPTTQIANFDFPDTIDLRGVAFDPHGTVTLDANQKLHVMENSHTYLLNFNPSDFTNETFHLHSDGHGGTKITLSSSSILPSVHTAALAGGTVIANVVGASIIAAPDDTIAGGSQDTIDLSHLNANTGGALIQDVGTVMTDTVIGFAEGLDHIAFLGETVAKEQQVLASAQLVNGSTVLTLPDHSQITLAGVAHVGFALFG